MVNAISQLFDPRNRIAIDQARQERELFPLKLAHLQGQTDLDAARALTEGAQQHYLGAQANDLSAITGFRNALGGALPQPVVPIQQHIDTFNNALQSVPGAPPPIQALPAPVMPSGAPGTGSVGDAPNPLLPPQQGYSPEQLARFAAAASHSPNPKSLIESLAGAEALGGPMTEDRSRSLLVAQGVAPNINTAVTPDWQVKLEDDKNDAAMNRVVAQQNGAMNRAVMNAEAVGKRTIQSALVKAAYGNSSPQALHYNDQRKMSLDAGQMADQVFSIQRDPNGNPSSAFNADLNHNVLAQRDLLAKRIAGHLKNGHDIAAAKDMSLAELFGSPNTGDPQFYTQGADPALGSLLGGRRPFSALSVNPDATGEVQRAGNPALNGPAMSALAQALTGHSEQPQEVATQPAQPLTPQQLATRTAPAPDPYAMRPSNAQAAQAKNNQRYAEMLRAEVAGIEQQIASGQQPRGGLSPWDAISSMFHGGRPVDLNSDNDARNALVQRRAQLLQEIQKLDPQSGGNGENGSDIVRRNLSP